MKAEEIGKTVREGYAKIAVQDTSCCGQANTCGCGSSGGIVSKALGYTDKQLETIPDRANLGLGCGNPTALASLKEGETVLDLGSGAGIDCFLAAKLIGESGRVIGVDMTAEMIEQARENIRKGNYKNVEFRLGEIEHLPVADNSIDIVISNCVINLSPDKGQVFKEAYRVLKPGGRLMISDIVLLKELPDAIKDSIEAYIGCVAGATTKKEYLAAIRESGFQDVEIVSEVSTQGKINDAFTEAISENLGIAKGVTAEVASSIVSMTIRAVKPS